MFSRYKFKDGFTTIKGNMGDARINYLGEIQSPGGETYRTFLDDEGHPCVSLNAWDGYRDYRIIELVMFQYKDIHIPTSEYKNIVPFVMDGDPLNTQANNVGYRFKNGPIETSPESGYFYIPSFTKYAISKTGNLINVNRNTEVKFYVTKGCDMRNITGGYLITNISSPNGTRAGLTRHRAMAFTFLDYPDNVDTLIVNHKDGIPGNDGIDNLEWITCSQNNTHAYMNDLKNQHMRVIVRDIRTMKDTEYRSLSECARQLGFKTGCSIRYRLYECPFGTVHSDGTQMKLKSDVREFPIIDDVESAIDAAKKRANIYNGDTILVRDCLTLKVTSHESIAHASKVTGVNRSTIQWRLDRDMATPCFGYQFMYVDDDRDFPAFTMEEYRDSLKPSATQVYARNLITGDTIEFTSVAQANEVFKGDISKTFRQDRQFFTTDGWQLKPHREEWLKIRNVESFLYALHREVVALEVDTGKEIKAISAREMSKKLNFACPKELRKAAMTKGKVIYKGYRFKLGYHTPWVV